MSLNMQHTFEQIATQLSLDSNLLIGYGAADKVGGFDSTIPPETRMWPLGAIWEVEGQILYALVRALKPEIVLQTGTGYGCSAAHIVTAMDANDKGKLISIDKDPGTGKWAQISDNHRQRITFIIDDAISWITNELDEQVDIFFQDATHDTDGVRREILAAVPKLKPGGLIIIHDADHFVVGKQIMEGLQLAGLDATVYSTAPSDCGLAIWRKPGEYKPEATLVYGETYTHSGAGATVEVKVDEEIPSLPPVQMPDEVDMGIQPFTPEPVFEPRQDLHRVPFTTTWIEPGKILIGSIPQLPEDLQSLRDMGIVSIVSLTRRDIASYPILHADNINIGHFPIPDNLITGDDIMMAAVDYMDSCAMPLYIHCRGGIGRSGMILLAYYVLKRGMSLADARELVKVRRNYEGNASAIDQGSPQREWIDALPDRLVSQLIEPEPAIGYSYNDMSKKELWTELLERGWTKIDFKGSPTNKPDLIRALEEEDAEAK